MMEIPNIPIIPINLLLSKNFEQTHLLKLLLSHLTLHQKTVINNKINLPFELKVKLLTTIAPKITPIKNKTTTNK